MSKKIAIIDIGSNSIRLFIFRRTSRFAFDLIAEKKNFIKSGSDIYNNGYLKDSTVSAIIETIKFYQTIIKQYKVYKKFTVATASFRNAKNQKEVLTKLRAQKIYLKVLSSEKEAYYGALAVNLLTKFTGDSLILDIGGGSTELTTIRDGEIDKTFSLNIGTLSANTEITKDNVEEFKSLVLHNLKDIDKEAFNNIENIITISGVTRTIAKNIQKNINYPIKKLHNFIHSREITLKHINNNLKIDANKIKTIYNIHSKRVKEIRLGAIILSLIIQQTDAHSIITCSVGVKEGIILNDILRGKHHKLPHNFDMNLKNLLDKNDILPSKVKNSKKIASKLFSTLKEYYNIKQYKKELLVSASLLDIGININYFSKENHSAYILLNSLEYNFTHKEIALIYTLIKFSSSSTYNKKHYEVYRGLLPSVKILDILYIIIVITKIISDNYIDSSNITININGDGSEITIDTNNHSRFIEMIDYILEKISNKIKVIFI